MRNSRTERFIKMKKWNANRRGIAFVLMLAMVFSIPMWSLAEAPTVMAGTTNIDLKPGQDNPAAYKKLTIEAGKATNDIAEFTINMALDDAFEDITSCGAFYKPYVKFISEGGITSDDSQFLGQPQKYYDYLEQADNTSLPHTTFTCDFIGVTTDVTIGGVLGPADGFDRIGEWKLETVTKDGKEVVRFTATLDKFLYADNVNDVVAGFKISLKSKKQNINDGDVTMNYDKDLDEITVTWPKEKPVAPTESYVYNITKSAMDSSNNQVTNLNTQNPYIDYKIDAAAMVTDTKTGQTTGTTMNGISIVDTVTQGKEDLVVDENNVSISTDGGINYTSISAGGTGGYTFADGIFTYKLPDYEELNPASLITQASVKVRMKLSEAAYNKFCYDGSIVKTYKDEASLTGEAIQVSTIPKSKEVVANMNITFFSKDGKAIGLTDTYNWSLKANTSFSGYSDMSAYIVDCIEDYDKIHMYITRGGVATIGKDGGVSNCDIEGTEIECDIPFKDITPGQIKALIAKSENNLEPNEWFYYTYKDTKSSKKTAVMIIPVTDYVNAPFEVIYQTKMQKQTPGGTSTKLKNNARIIWEATWTGGGKGPSYNPTAEATLITKDVIADYQLMTKSADRRDYDESNREVTWNFVLNKYGAEMSGVNVVDTLNDKEQKFKSNLLDGTANIIVKKIDREKPTSTASINLNKYDGTGNAPENYYKITTASGCTTLTVHFDKIPSSEVYEFSISTKVFDPTVLANQGQGYVKNSAKVETIVDGKNVSQSAVDVSKLVKSTLIRKEATAKTKYNYVDHSIEWKAVINPYQICIASKGGITSGAAMTDILPVGTYFGKVTGATRKVFNGDTQVGTVDNDGNISFPEYLSNGTVISKCLDVLVTAGAFSGNRATQVFSLSDATSDKIQLTYTTVYGDDYRKEHFKSTNKEDKEDVRNECILEGSAGADVTNLSEIINANDWEGITISAPPLAKSGIYHGGTDPAKGEEYIYADGTSSSPAGMVWISWNVEVNRDQTSMGATMVVDELKDCFELEPTSFKIWQASPDANTTDKVGTLVTTSALEETEVKQFITDGALQLYTTGFAFTIPNTPEYRNKSLIFTFNTFIIETVKAEAMTNKVILKGGTPYKDETVNNGVSGAVSFDIGNYAKATLSPSITVIKESKDNIGLKLEGAEFTLTPVIYKSKDDISRNTALKKTKVTIKTKGTAVFRNLRTDTLYELEETKAPAGYKRPTEVKYVIFNPQKASYPSEETNVVKYASAKDQTSWIPTILNTTGKGEIPPGVVPTDSSISVLHFTKQTDDGQILPGVEFNITWNKRIPLSKNATSDVDGKVLFSNLDAGKYTITEVANNNTAFKTIPNGTLKAEVKFDIINGYSFTITDGGLGVLEGNYPNYIVKNQYKRGTVKLDKLEKDTNIKLSDAEFEVMKDADRVAYLTEGTTTKGSYYLSNTDSENKNTVGDIKNSFGSKYLTNQNGEWKLLIGDYTIRETKVPSNYVEILENGQPNINASGAAVTSYAITIGEDTEKQITVENIYAGGEIMGHKYNDATTPAGLIGATIGLFVPSTTTFDAIHTYKGMTTISTTGGAFTFKEIPFGEYLLVEITPPGGYYLNQTPVAVEVTRTAVGSTAVVTVTKNVGGEDIIITNAAIRSSGGGGGGSSVVPPVEPPIIPPIKPPLVPPTPPIVPPTPPVNPPIIIPPPGQGEVVIPINPDGVTPGDTIFEVEGDDGIIADIVIGKDGNLQLPKLPPGTYTLKNMTTGDTVEFIIEDEQVPLASMDPDGLLDSINALNTPRTGVDNTMEYILLALMLFSIMGLSVVVYKIKKESK